MRATKAFQVIAATNWIAWAIYYFLPDTLLSSNPDAIELRRYSGLGAILPVDALAIASLWASLVATVGLVFFQNWGRYLMLILCAVNLVLAPFKGVAVNLPIDVVAGSLSTLVDGLVLGMAFAPSLSSHFLSRPDDDGTTPIDGGIELR